MLAPYATAVPAGPPYGLVVHEKRHAFAGLHKSHQLDPESIVKFHIGLKQSNLEHGYTSLLNVSDPQSSSYGKLWTAQQVQNFFGPSQDSSDTVWEWLSAAGVRDVEERRGWLSFEVPVAHVERLLDTKYYEHVGNDGAMRIGCDK